MNIYFVLSDSIYHVEWEDWFNNVGHREDYCIATYVRANSRGQAQYLAWRNDNSFNPGDIRDMPRMSVRKVMADVEGEPGVIDWGDTLIETLDCCETVGETP